MKSDLSIRARFRVVLASVSILLGASTAGAEDRIKVVATFSVIGDMVANVAGDKVDLVTLVGPAGDTELFKPSLADGKDVAEAKIVFMNDLNDQFEPWLEPLLKQVKFSGAKIIVSRGAKTHTSTEERGPRSKFGRKRSTSTPGSTRRTVSSTSGTSQPPWQKRSRQCRGISCARGCLHQGIAGCRRLGEGRDRRVAGRKAACSGLARFVAISGEGLRHYAAVHQWLDQQQRAVRG